MPNIAITNCCNLNCSYCFANKYKQQEKSYINFQQLNKIFFWLEQSHYKYKNIRIIGGEPTLHPNFRVILNYFLNFANNNCIDKNILFFSNGIELYKYADCIIDYVQVLLNINEKKIISSNNFNKIILSIEETKKYGNLNNIRFGINLYHNMKDFKYIFDLAKEYNKKYIRYSFVVPKDIQNKKEYYKNGKNLILDFYNLSYKYDIKLSPDCNYIPICYFNDKEIQLINKQNIKPFHSQCTGAVDIFPNFTAIQCFGINKPIDLNNFKNYQELQIFFNKQYNILINKNNDKECNSCKLFLLKQCQGGCLKFLS